MSLTKDQILRTMEEQSAMQNARKLVGNVSEECFDKCILKPGPSTSSSEEKCITSCMEKFMNAWNITSRAYVQRLQQEAQSRGGLQGL